MKANLIGLGRISNLHIEAIKSNNLFVRSICDLDFQKIQAFKLKFRLSSKIYRNHSDFQINKVNDLAIIMVSSGEHYRIAMDLVHKEYHLLIEKPLSLSIQEIDDLIQASKDKHIKITVSHQNRFNYSVQRLYNSIENHKLGKLFYGVACIRWNRSQAYYDQADWRGKWRSDGGALMNQSIHNIDLLLWMMGSPVVEVFGYIDNKNHPSIEVEDMGVALLKFANGSFGIIESSMNTYPENFEETLSIFGENGTVVLGGKSVNKIIHWNVKDDPIDDLEKFNEEVDSVYGNGHIALYKDFIEAIEQDREPAITLQDGRNAVEVILAIYLSSFEKRPVQLPLPADTSTIMFEGKSFK
jgi:UDP-N-acetyl-2-amino-2-deoxyglucuronate dehydrogenase